VRRIYEESGALKRAVERMRRYAEGCRKALAAFNPSEALNCLLHLVESYYLKLEV